MNATLALGSFIALIVISCKHCEGFTIWSLLVVFLTCTLMTAIQCLWFKDRVALTSSYCISVIAVSTKYFAV